MYKNFKHFNPEFKPSAANQTLGFKQRGSNRLKKTDGKMQQAEDKDV